MTSMAAVENVRRYDALKMENDFLLFPQARLLIELIETTPLWRKLLPWNLVRLVIWSRRADKLRDQIEENLTEMRRLVISVERGVSMEEM